MSTLAMGLPSPTPDLNEQKNLAIPQEAPAKRGVGKPFAELYLSSHE